MGLQAVIRPSTDTYVGALFNAQWKKTYSLSCKKTCIQNIISVAVRIFIALLTIGAATLDLLTWIANTVTIAPICKVGVKRHLAFIISTIVSLILTPAIPFGYNPKVFFLQTDKKPKISGDPKASKGGNQTSPAQHPDDIDLSTFFSADVKSYDSDTHQRYLTLFKQLLLEGGAGSGSLSFQDNYHNTFIHKMFINLVHDDPFFANIDLCNDLIDTILASHQSEFRKILSIRNTGDFAPLDILLGGCDIVRYGDLIKNHPYKGYGISSILAEGQDTSEPIMPCNVHQWKEEHEIVALRFRKFSFFDPSDGYTYLVVRLILNGAFVDLDFERYLKDVKQVIADLSFLWPDGRLSYDSLFRVPASYNGGDIEETEEHNVEMSKAMEKKKIAKAIKKLLKSPNAYSRRLGKMLKSVNDNHDIRLGMMLLYLPRFIYRLIARKRFFLEARQQKLNFLKTPVGLPKPLIDIIDGYLQSPS